MRISDWSSDVCSSDLVPPFAPWDASPPSRIRGVGNLFGEKPTGTLAEEIMTPGPGQIRALIVDGSNIANSVPDRERMIARTEERRVGIAGVSTCRSWWCQ